MLSDEHSGRREALDFEYQSIPFRWEFDITSDHGAEMDWQSIFYEKLEHFLEIYLQGTFFHIWLGDQSIYSCYLSRQTVADLIAIQKEMERDCGSDGFAAFVGAL